MQLELFLANELSDEFPAIFVPCSGRRRPVWLPADVPGSGTLQHAPPAGRASPPALPAAEDGSTAEPRSPPARPAPPLRAARGWLARRFQLGERRLAAPTPPRDRPCRGPRVPAPLLGCGAGVTSRVLALPDTSPVLMGSSLFLRTNLSP